jgi:CelD/BcsL family acetyltransferase involved in cellulose biosynthesis
MSQRCRGVGKGDASVVWLQLDLQVASRVEITRDAARLVDIAPQWDELAAAALEPNPSYESWMLLPALRTLGRASAVQCVLVWEQRSGPTAATRLVGFLPFQRFRSIRGLPAPMLSSWCHSSFLLGSPLVRADCAEDCLRTLLDWIDDSANVAAVEFRHLPADGAFYGLLARELQERRCAKTETRIFSRAMLCKAENADHYLKRALSKNDRHALRRRERRLRECGTLTRVALGPGDDPTSWLRDLLRLEASGWKGKSGGAFSCDEAQHRFAIEALTAAHARGRLKIVGIDLDGRPLSRQCILTAGTCSYAYRTAYDETYAQYGPGVMVAIDTIRAFHELPGVDCMDSLTAPDNDVLNRLWLDRRTIHSMVVPTQAWGGMWVRLLPLLRRVKHILTGRFRQPSVTR